MSTHECATETFIACIKHSPSDTESSALFSALNAAASGSDITIATGSFGRNDMDTNQIKGGLVLGLESVGLVVEALVYAVGHLLA